MEKSLTSNGQASLLYWKTTLHAVYTEGELRSSAVQGTSADWISFEQAVVHWRMIHSCDERGPRRRGTMISIKLSHGRAGFVRLHVVSVSASCLFCVTRRSRSYIHDSHWLHWCDPGDQGYLQILKFRRHYWCDFSNLGILTMTMMTLITTMTTLTMMTMVTMHDDLTFSWVKSIRPT